MQPGQIQYGLLEDKDGQVVADLTTWKLADNDYEIFLGRHRDLLQIENFLSENVVFQDLSTQSSIFALQGPESLGVMAHLCDSAELASLKYFEHASFTIAGIPCRIGRLGYTGEKGFEIVVDDPVKADSLWQALAALSPPAGMIAADMLRIEAGFILFLNECRLGCTAIELGLQRFSRSLQHPERYQLICFTASTSKAPLPWSARMDPDTPDQGELLVTSANRNSLSGNILGLGLARTDSDFHSEIIDYKGIFDSIQLVDRPYYDPSKSVPREPWSVNQ